MTYNKKIGTGSGAFTGGDSDTKINKQYNRQGVPTNVEDIYADYWQDGLPAFKVSREEFYGFKNIETQGLKDYLKKSKKQAFMSYKDFDGRRYVKKVSGECDAKGVNESMSEDEAHKKIEDFFKKKVSEGEVLSPEDVASKIMVPPRHVVTFMEDLVKKGYAEVDSKGTDKSGWDTEYVITTEL